MLSSLDISGILRTVVIHLFVALAQLKFMRAPGPCNYSRRNRKKVIRVYNGMPAIFSFIYYTTHELKKMLLS